VTLPIIDADAVAANLTMDACIELMAEVQRAISRGDHQLPLRTFLTIDGANTLGVMPGVLNNPAICGAKLITLFPDNPSAGEPAIQGNILLFDNRNGSPLALVDAASITAMRTAAASGAATRILANDQARVLAVLGCGVQAETHIAAMRAVRSIDEIRIWGRRTDKARDLAARHGGIAADNIEAAVGNADIVCCVTGAHQPILEGRWLSPGVHVNLVGAHTASSREADTETIRRARVFTEIAEFANGEAGDILLAIDDGVDPAVVVGEIGQVLNGKLEGRTSPSEVTVYKSLGNVAQDLAAAYHAYQQWTERGTP
jgi:ornithine cyclodeaminase